MITIPPGMSIEDLLDAAVARVAVLEAAIRRHRDQRADDRCIEDDDVLYAALGDGVRCDRRVGDKLAMLANCARFINRRCEGGHWPSYLDLETRLATTTAALGRIHAAAWARRRCPTCGYYPFPGNQDPDGKCQSCNGTGYYRVLADTVAGVLIALENEGVFDQQKPEAADGQIVAEHSGSPGRKVPGPAPGRDGPCVAVVRPRRS